MTESQHTIAGTVLTMPVKVRTAAQHMAMFSVDADAAQAMIDYSGLQVCRYRAREADRRPDADALSSTATWVRTTNTARTSWSIPLVRCAGLRAVQSAAAFVHHLPVDQAFTLEAGQTIWGYPKVMADFTVRDGRSRVRRQHRRTVRGRHGVSPRPAGPVRRSPRASRCTPRTRIATVSSERPLGRCPTRGCGIGRAGVTVRLGEHPYAKELASLGFPKRALFPVRSEQRSDVVR